MGILSKLLTPVSTDAVAAVSTIVGSLYTTEGEKLEKQTILMRLAQEPQLAQIALGQVEAAHRSLFVAGARPFILWVCGIGLAFVFVINPLIQWTTDRPGPAMQTDSLLELVIAILGLGGLRTLEKLAGKAK